MGIIGVFFRSYGRRLYRSCRDMSGSSRKAAEERYGCIIDVESCLPEARALELPQG